jgi:hypothetical protein
MSDMNKIFVGRWEKLPGPPCSETYPDHIEFRENGLYFGHREPAGTYCLWDAGTFEVVSPSQVKISTAYDAVITYGFTTSNDVVTFVAPDQCQFQYKRAV